MNSLPNTVTQQHSGCDLTSTPESSTLTTRLPSHPVYMYTCQITCQVQRVYVCIYVQCFDAVGWVAGRASGL